MTLHSDEWQTSAQNKAQVHYIDAVRHTSAQLPKGYCPLLWEPLRDEPWPSTETQTSKSRDVTARTPSDNVVQLGKEAEEATRLFCSALERNGLADDTEKSTYACHAPAQGFDMPALLYDAVQRKLQQVEHLRSWNERIQQKASVREEENETQPAVMLRGVAQSLDVSAVLQRLVLNADDKRHAWLSVRYEKDSARRAEICLPPHGGFLWTDLLSSSSSLHSRPHGWDQALSFANSTAPPHLLLLDPPYPNVSATRLKRKRSAYDPVSDLYSLWHLREPVQDLLDVEGTHDCFVACWVTNHAKVQSFVLDKLFPAWNVEHVGQLVWLKCTTKGVPVVPLLNAQGRRPYEILLIGGRKGEERGARKSGDERFTNVFASIPTAHSRKPPVLDFLRSCLSEQGLSAPLKNVYEFFSRSISSDSIKGGYWIGMGNEPCLFNQLDVGFCKV